MNIEKEFKKFKKLMPKKSDEDIYNIINSKPKAKPLSEEELFYKLLSKKFIRVSSSLILILNATLVGYGIYADDLLIMGKIAIGLTIGISFATVTLFAAYIKLTRNF